ncbi:MAG: type II toxin-antitoxin system PemK/MazF family toxin, partial [Angustibacter sp.]
FEEDHALGKDWPVLVVGFDGKWLLALMLSSQDRAPRGGVDHHQGREWLDVGPGAWDPRGRPSEVRLDRVLRIAPETVRREGAQLDQSRFALVAQALRERYGWS